MWNHICWWKLIFIQLGGLKEGDFIVELSGVDVKWYSQNQIVKLIRNAKQSLDLKVITPIDRNYLKVGFCIRFLFFLSINWRFFLCFQQPLVSTPSMPSTPSTTTSKSSISARSTASAEHRSKKKLSGDKHISSWRLFRRTQSLGKLFWIRVFWNNLWRTEFLFEIYREKNHSSSIRLMFKFSWDFR